MQAGLPQTLKNPYILYEDNHVLAVYKPAGWETQPGQNTSIDLMAWAKNYLKEKYAKPGNVFLGLIHRLDKPVCGVVVFGRTSKGASRLSEAFRQKKTEKIYWAWVKGEFKDTESTHWKAYLSKEANPTVQVFATQEEDTVEADMYVKCLKTEKKNSLLEIQLGTGRKHQIRAMLAAKGFPILGDNRYASPEPSPWPDQIALMAKKLILPHPVSENLLELIIEDSSWMKQWQ